MVQNERSSAFVTVTCPCGRGLRAKFEQAGTEIRCWDCHKMILVPIPHPGQKVAKELSDGALTVIKGPGLHLVFAASAVVTAALAVPYYGVWCSAVVLIMGGSAYGEIIRRVSRETDEGPGAGWLGTLLPKSPWKFALCLLLAMGTVVPLWWLNAGPRQSPHFDRIGRAIVVSTWTFVPLLMLMAYGRTGEDAPLGPRRCLKIMAGHPFALFLALAVVPITMMLLEVTLALVFYIPGNLYFFALDYMPMPVIDNQDPVMHNGVPHYNSIDFRGFPLFLYEKGYLDGLRHGYSFVGGFPASLSSRTRAGMDCEVIGLHEPLYLIARVFIVLVIVSCLLAALAVQARWLGSIPALDRRRSA
jgi:ribosomal protein S27E